MSEQVSEWVSEDGWMDGRMDGAGAWGAPCGGVGAGPIHPSTSIAGGSAMDGWMDGYKQV